MNTILMRLDAYQQALEEVNDKSKEIEVLKGIAQTLKDELITEMIEEEIPSITRGSYSYSLVSKTKYSKKAGADEELVEVLRDHNLGALVKETVNAQSLNAAMNQEADNNGGELPEDLEAVVNTYTFNDISKRKKSK